MLYDSAYASMSRPPFRSNLALNHHRFSLATGRQQVLLCWGTLLPNAWLCSGFFARMPPVRKELLVSLAWCLAHDAWKGYWLMEPFCFPQLAVPVLCSDVPMELTGRASVCAWTGFHTDMPYLGLVSPLVVVVRMARDFREFSQ